MKLKIEYIIVTTFPPIVHRFNQFDNIFVKNLARYSLVWLYLESQKNSILVNAPLSIMTNFVSNVCSVENIFPGKQAML